MRKTKKRIILMAETNFLLDLGLGRHKNCIYLATLATNEEIQLAIPEYAFAEAIAKLKDIEKRHVQQFEQARLALKEISASVMPAAERAGIEASLIRAAKAIRETIARAQVALSRTRKFADVIPFTPEIHAASHLRRIAHLPPYDVKGLEIYESILAFARLNRSPRFAIIFLERDAAHFDLPEIKDELAAAGVAIYFSAGEATRRVRELL